MAIYYRDDDHDLLQDMTEYGATPMKLGYVYTFELKSGGYFHLRPGVYVVKSVVDEIIENAFGDLESIRGTFMGTLYEYMMSVRRAIHKYNALKRLRMLKYLVYIDKHYKDTMEKSYSPGGTGYFRILQNSFVGVKKL